MKIVFNFIFVIALVFISFSARAVSCDSPNFDGCQISDEERVIMIEAEDVSINNSSNMKIGSMIFTKNNLNLSLTNSILDTNRLIPSNYDYKINLTLDASTFIFRNANSLTIEDLTLNNNSVFKIQGFSSVSVNNLESSSDKPSKVAIKNSFSILSLKKANIGELYLTAGYLRVREDEATIDNIYSVCPKNICPEDETEEESSKDTGYQDLTTGGYIEITDKGTLTTNILEANQVHVMSGTLNIDGDYKIGILDNRSSSSIYDKDDKIVNLNADGIITYIDIDSLTVKGKMGIQNGGSITNLNYAKDSNGDFIGTEPEQGTLEYFGYKIPDKDGNIDENAKTPSLTLRSVYLDRLILHDGDVIITTKDSTINNITNPEENGSLRVEYVDNMKSDSVELNKLTIYSSNYNVNGTFDVKNLTLTSNAELNLDTANSLIFDTLSLSTYSKINSNNNPLDITVNNELNIFNAMLEVGTLTMGNDSTLNIGIDNNLRDDNLANLNSGIKATGNIDLGNTKIVANLQDTSLFNLSMEHSYNVLHSDTDIKWNGEGSTNLPEWFSANFRIDNNNLFVAITREESYEQLLRRANINDESTINVAKALDKMVKNQTFTKDLAEVITRIDLRSNINNIGNNLASLRPVSNDVYISDIHTTANIYLEMLLQNSNYSYLKTKDKEENILWLRNGFKRGNSNGNNFYSGNSSNTYFVMAGFDILGFNLSESHFQLGVAGGLNFSDIRANDSLYDINSSGFNVSMYANYVANRFAINLNTMYLNSIYDTTRTPLNSQVDSSLNVSEIVSSIEFVSKNSFHDNIFFEPSIFYTNGFITAGNTSETGYAGFNLPKFNTTIHDAGVGALLYTDFKDTLFNVDILQGSYLPYISLKTFYRMYDVPNTNINFLNTVYGINIIGAQQDSMVVRGSVGVDYEKNANILGIKYTYENSFNNYNNHQFHLNYKFLLN
ncbi:MAG: autotransporter outer membrane beta-barrel domain-containing protein [Alphaproteobacteria bacterium]|jgi:hypothetical protein|nr:autotransporter outer membrane beta-barrel domain-containing protein [Alphaproteobacteria bacterium]